MNKTPLRDTVHASAGTDTLRISVQARERTVNYDSIFRSQSPYLPGTRRGGSERRDIAPRKAATAPSRKDPGVPGTRTVNPPATGSGRTAAIRHPDDHFLHSGLAGRTVMSGGLILILAGVVLELFLKRKSRALSALGLAALLGGLLLL